jgi:hypothetical protein
MNTMTVIATSGKLSSLLLNSIQVLSSVCPLFLLATMSAALHRGQSGQPRPDELSLTAAPVDMITVSAMTPASAICLIDRGVGDRTGLAIGQASILVIPREIRARRSAGTPLW